MSWLTPLGFIGFIGLVILIIIYIIKPNYQNKIISSTFVWKLSLKYKKNKFPLSKLRNILIFICQVLIVSIIATMLAQPFIQEEKAPNEKVLILDASASMMTEVGGVTRFERALDELEKGVDEVLDNGGLVSIIVAHDSAYFLTQRADFERKTEVHNAINELRSPASGTNLCTFGTPDIAGAISLSERITESVMNVEVIMYTDTQYIKTERIKIVPITDVSEWNAAVLDVRATLIEGFFRFEIDVASYALDTSLSVECTISGANEEKDEITLNHTVRCEGDEVQTLVFGLDIDLVNDPVTEVIEVESYEEVYIQIRNANDSFGYDNSFHLYGGEKLPLKVQYCSSKPNNFFASAMMVLREQLSYRWDFKYDEVKPETEPALEGYDFYIFEEERIPATLPTDGVVIIVNPNELPSSSGIKLGAKHTSQTSNADNPMEEGATLVKGEVHPITEGLTVENIRLTSYTKVTSYDGYEVLMYGGNDGEDPLLLVKNEAHSKMVVMPFSLNYSNFSMLLEFPLMVYNIIEYFAPSTITEYVFDINESLTLKARGETLELVGQGMELVMEEFPASVKLVTPGIYTLSQTIISGEDVVENFYVKVPAEESHINLVEDVLTNPYFMIDDQVDDLDLLLYFAIALVTLLFAEWWLKTREQS